MLAEGSPVFLGWDELIRFGTVAIVVWSAAWFLFNQQNKIRDVIYKEFAKIIDKLEYHERHDDQRFDNINKSLIDVRLAQARSSNRITKYLDNGNGKNGQ